MMRSLIAILSLSAASIAFSRDRLLVVVNPNAGGGHALKYYQDSVKPLLSQEYDLEEFISAEPKKTQKYLKTHQHLTSLQGIVGVGGDGTIFEIYNGLASSNLGRYHIPRLPIAHIPAGSGNALARSIHHRTCGNATQFSKDAMLKGILEKKYHSLDLWNFETDRGEDGLLFLGFSLGIISDIDIDSEWLRPYLGSLRFDVYGVWKWLISTSYQAALRLSGARECFALNNDFRQIWGMNIPFATETIQVSADGQLDDEKMHLVYLPTVEAGWSNLFEYLIKIETPAVHDLPFVHMNTVRDSLELKTDKYNKITVDGELLGPGTTRLTIEKSKFRGKVFGASCETEATHVSP